MSKQDIDARIAQWEQMAREAPDDMAYFSLGNAYKDAQRYLEAEQALAEALKLNDQMSRAYQLRGQVLIKLDRTDEAAALLEKGYLIAASRGDVMPQRAMGSLLEQMGRTPPQVEIADQAQAEDVDEEGMILDRRSGQLQPRLDGPPMRGPMGAFIFDHFGQVTWNTWIRQGTKVINELRLDFSNPDHQDIYDQQMLEWLGVTQQEIAAYEQERGKGN
ncbi:MAG: Fe(2+)-trafficking protein [Phycisphaeraceae bacterium]|nr:Fe(2+)-trafficking protein [Phycisphaeraceae bacterium]